MPTSYDSKNNILDNSLVENVFKMFVQYNPDANDLCKAFERGAIKDGFDALLIGFTEAKCVMRMSSKMY